MYFLLQIMTILSMHFLHRLVILSLLDTNSVPMKVHYTEQNLSYSKSQ